MIIDTHVHCFPDLLAKRAVLELAERGTLYPYNDGTLDGAKKVCRNAGVDKFIHLNIATKPTQQKTVNDWAISLLNDDMAIPFGSIHPLCEDKLEELERIADAGIKGIKLHPDYQSYFVDDPSMDGVYDKCGKLGLIVILHAGMDLGLPDPIHATPDRVANIVRRHPSTIFVAAHMGGFRVWDGVKEYLCGLDNLYFDTAYCSLDLPLRTATEIIESHGADKILMASDLPWEDPAKTLKMIDLLEISESDKAKIKGGNTMKLLNLSFVKL